LKGPHPGREIPGNIMRSLFCVITYAILAWSLGVSALAASGSATRAPEEVAVTQAVVPSAGISADASGADHAVAHADHAAHGDVHADAAGSDGDHGGGAVGDHHGSGHADGEMHHPGLQWPWISHAAVAMAAILIWCLFAPPTDTPSRSIDLGMLPGIGHVVRFATRSPYPLLAVRIVSVAVFILVIAAGLFGSAYPERNFATTLVWNLWWPLVVVSVLFVGTAWCAVCPWDALAGWIVRRRLWRRVSPHPGFNLKVPSYLRNVWLALLMFMGLTWLELGANVTGIPFATAIMASEMLFLSLIFLLLFERRAFCRYACPVGRTLGCYSRVAPVSVRPVEQGTCDGCTTLECYNGSAHIEPCPTHLTVGRFSQNTYCLSCGNCMLSCPHKNVTWRLRPMGSEAGDRARPQLDETWFMLALLGITSFHGLTMMPFWGDWVTAIAGAIGDGERRFASFTLAMLGGFAFPSLIYAAAIGLLRLILPRGASYKKLFAAFSFVALPLAFVYHMAHNMDHLLREGEEALSVATNPFGTDLEPMSAADRHQQMMSVPIPDEWLFTVQAALMVLGFFLAAQIARQRGVNSLGNGDRVVGWRLLPVLGFIIAITAMNLALMSHDMTMRF